MIRLSRRAALQTFGGGLVIGFSLPAEAFEPIDGTITAGPLPSGVEHELNAWLRIGEDNTVTIRVGASEMGQGVLHALPMIVADELGCAWEQVRAESSPAHRDYARPLGYFGVHMQLTGGSWSVRGYWESLRDAGAAARMMLRAEAAARLGVAEHELRWSPGAFASDEKSLTYGELAAGAARRRPPTKLDYHQDYLLLGTSPPRLDIPPKVNGTATFGTDVPCALVGTVIVCPHYGGKLESFDDTAAKAIPGVRAVLAFEEEVVVVADHFYQAKKAADYVKIVWDAGPSKGLDDAAILAAHEAGLARSKPVEKRGSVPEGQRFSLKFSAPYLDHATMEPMSCTASVTADRVDIWQGTQIQQMTRNKAAKLTGLSPEQVFVHTTYLGGGFGRRSEWMEARVAVMASMALNAPIKLQWTREQTFARGALRPMALCEMEAVLDHGTITHLRCAVAAQNILARFVPGFLANGKLGAMVAVEGLAKGPYAIPAVDIRYGDVELPIVVGWWRSVHGSFAGFFRECFIDACAAELKRDPVELRRELLADNPKFLAVLNLAVEKAPSLPSGQTRGVAIFESFGSIVAHVADCSVTDGALRVHHVTAAIDCGTVVHPDTVRAQVMGAAIMGLSMAKGEALHFVDGAVVERNFHTYPLLGPADAPEVDVHIVPSNAHPGGVGEPGLPPIPAAVANAYFAATGKRLTAMPFGV